MPGGAADAPIAVGDFRCDCPLGKRGRECGSIAEACFGGNRCANGGTCYVAADAAWSSAVTAALASQADDQAAAAAAAVGPEDAAACGTVCDFSGTPAIHAVATQKT